MSGLLHETNIGDNTFAVDIVFDEINIDKSEIEILLGYEAGQVPHHFDDLIENAINDLPNRINIKAGYRYLKADYDSNKSNGLYVGGKFFYLEKIVAGIFKKSEEAILFCVTIGDGMELHSKALLKKEDLVNGYVYDIVASHAVEACANALHDHIIAKMILLNKKTTNRYSPGYCNWKVDEQHLLFSFLPKDFCGINLTVSALMTPIKSISGIIGIGGNVKYLEYSCNECNMKDCTYRTINSMKKKTN